MATARRVLIVGGGLGGLTLGVALARTGIAAEVVELSPDGAVPEVGLLLPAPALRALAAIGLLEQALACGFPQTNRMLCSPAGDVLGVQELPGLLGPGLPAQLGISRSAFHEVLLDACRDRGVDVRFGLTVQSLEQLDSGVAVQLSDGNRRHYDAVVGADGLASEVRRLLFGDAAQPVYTGLAAWQIRTPRPAGVEGVIHYRGGLNWVGFNPTANDEGDIFIVEPVTRRRPVTPAFLLRRLPRVLAGYGGVISWLLPRITDPTGIVYWPVETILQPPPWYRGDVMLIGDAVHAPAPFFATGVALALEDGVVLAEELARAETVADAFAGFMARRYDRCKLVVDTTLELGEWLKNPAATGTSPESLRARVATELLKPI